MLESGESVPNSRIRSLRLEGSAEWDDAGSVSGHYLGDLSLSTPAFYFPDGADAYQHLVDQLLALEISADLVDQFMRGETTPQELVDLANSRQGFAERSQSDGITLGDVLEALGNIKVSIGFQAGFKFGTDKIALKFIVGVEVNVADLAVAAAYAVQPVVNEITETVQEVETLTTDIDRLNRALEDPNNEEPQDPKPWRIPLIEVWGWLFGVEEQQQ